ncbi:MAG: DUF3108 domain-containing protein [Bacteriovoracaceae bacterium]
MKRYIWISSVLFLGAFLTSCSTTEKDIKEVKQTEETPDLLKTFDIKGTEFDKFKDTPKEAVAMPIPLDSKVTATKKDVKAQEKALDKKNKKDKKQDSVVENFVGMTPNGFKYPKDYPDDYKNYDKKSEIFWKEAKPSFKNGEQMVFDVKYFGITAGQIALTVLPQKEIGGKTCHHFHVKMTSAPFYKMIYEVNDYLDSYVDVERFLPVKYMVVQRESKQDVDDLQLFDNEKLTTFYRYRRLKKKTNEEKNESDQKFVPRFYQDSFSVLYFFRSLPLHTGETYEFPIITRAKPWMIKVTPEKIETISTKLGRREAFRVNAITQYPGVLKANGEAIFWISNDDKKQILKFSAKVKLGTIEGELVDLVDGK